MKPKLLWVVEWDDGRLGRILMATRADARRYVRAFHPLRGARVRAYVPRDKPKPKQEFAVPREER